MTWCIERTIRVLSKHRIETVVLSSEPYGGTEPLNVAVIPALAYTRENEKPDPGALAFAMNQAARRALGREPDVWHFHNHSIGKNNGFPQALTRLFKNLVAEKTGMLLQIHDFAEDGRAANYEILRNQVLSVGPLYPLASQIHYAVDTEYDRKMLLRAGFPSDQLHWLPDPVVSEEKPEEGIEDISGEFQRGALWLHPTYGTRRENMGEFLLWAILHGKSRSMVNLLLSEEELNQPVYERWMRFAAERKIPVQWEKARGADHWAKWLLRSERVLTCSQERAYDAVYLEPWLMGKSLSGRERPDVRGELKAAGIELPGLHSRIPVPLAWIGKDAFFLCLKKSMQDICSAFGYPFDPDAPKLAYDAMVKDDMVDFGCLDEWMQEQVLDRLLESRENQKFLRDIIKPGAVDGERIRLNAESVRESFGLEAHGKRLIAVYQSIMNSPYAPMDFLPSDKVLASFLDPTRFNLLRTE